MSWKCPECTYANDPSDDQCWACESARPKRRRQRNKQVSVARVTTSAVEVIVLDSDSEDEKHTKNASKKQVTKKQMRPQRNAQVAPPPKRRKSRHTVEPDTDWRLEVLGSQATFSPSETKPTEEASGLWSHSFAPKNASELCINKKRIQETKQWLQSALKGHQRLLFLTGPTGCGKSTLVTVLARDLGCNVSTVEYGRTPAGAADSSVSHMWHFEQALLRSVASWKSIYVVELFPPLQIAEIRSRFHILLHRLLRYRGAPVVFTICTCKSDLALWRDVDESVRLNSTVHTIELPALSDTAVRKTLTQMASTVTIPLASKSTIEQVSQASQFMRQGGPTRRRQLRKPSALATVECAVHCAKGDMRAAFNALQFGVDACANSDEHLTLFRTVGRVLHRKQDALQSALDSTTMSHARLMDWLFENWPSYVDPGEDDKQGFEFEDDDDESALRMDAAMTGTSQYAQLLSQCDFLLSNGGGLGSWHASTLDLSDAVRAGATMLAGESLVSWSTRREICEAAAVTAARGFQVLTPARKASAFTQLRRPRDRTVCEAVAGRLATFHKHRVETPYEVQQVLEQRLLDSRVSKSKQELALLVAKCTFFRNREWRNATALEQSVAAACRHRVPHLSVARGADRGDTASDGNESDSDERQRREQCRLADSLPVDED